MMVRRRGDWLIAKVGDHHVIMSREKVRNIGITSVGARIWDLIETPQEVDVICAQLRTEYAIAPEACRAEVDAFLSDMAQRGAVVIDQASAG